MSRGIATALRALGAALPMALVAGRAAAQGTDSSGLLTQVVMDFASRALVWLAVWWVVFVLGLVVAAWLAGVRGGPLRGCLSLLLGGVIAALPVFLAALVLGGSGDETTSVIVLQAISLAGLWLGVKIVFRTDFQRALLILLLGSTFALVVTAGLLVVLV